MRLRVRLQAAFHSCLLMCVAGSQKPMQSLRVFPPPPGVLGADSLGLPGDSARLPPDCAGVPPPERMLGCSAGESGATLGTCGARVPIAGAGAGAGVAGGGVGAGSGSIAPLGDEARPVDERDCVLAVLENKAIASPATRMARLSEVSLQVRCMNILVVAAPALVRHNVKINVVRYGSFRSCLDLREPWSRCVRCAH